MDKYGDKRLCTNKVCHCILGYGITVRGNTCLSDHNDYKVVEVNQ